VEKRVFFVGLVEFGDIHVPCGVGRAGEALKSLEGCVLLRGNRGLHTSDEFGCFKIIY
jgi:hypothetical protein